MGIPLTVEGMKKPIIWMDENPTNEELAWRRSICSAVLVVQQTLLQLGPVVSADEWIAYPSEDQKDRLAYGLLYRHLPDGVHGSKSDQMDLALLFGKALAFAHDHCVGDALDVSQGVRDVYEILAQVLERRAQEACKGQSLPSWSDQRMTFLMANMNEEIGKSEAKNSYLAWADNHEIALSFLSAFWRHTGTEIQPPWNDDLAVHGCMFLRLAAGSVPRRISDQ